jgi:hypothetical protein
MRPTKKAIEVLPGFSGDFSLDFLRAFRMEAVLTRISRAAN